MAWDANIQRIEAALEAARQANAAIVCLPELCITGYGCEDMFFSSGVQQAALDLLPALAARTGGLIACFGLPVTHDGRLYNTAAVACNGRLLGLVAKQHLAGDGIHYEPRWFHRWPAGEVGTLEIVGRAYPIGDLLFDCGGVRIGLEICRDAWVSDRTGARLAQRGADVILNPSASHFAFAKQQIRERLVLEGSRNFCVSYAYANMLGNEAGRSIYDGGTLIASGGEMLVRGPRFSFGDWVLTSAEVDVAATRRARAESAAERPALAADDEPGLVVSEFRFPDIAAPMPGKPVAGGGKRSDREFSARSSVLSSGGDVPGHPAWETGPHQKEEEFARAVALGLFDYLRKSGANGIVLSLSGGADSSAVATLVYLMVRLGEGELGRRLYATRAGAGLSQRDAGSCPLTCVYQYTRNSSAETLAAARTVAQAVGAEFLQWSVDDLVDDYVATVSAAVGRRLDWQQDDLALQNIQARARAPGAWLLANLRGALLVATSNRSEAAVGYATMDGDTCGGLAPIAGIDKAFLLDWLKWMETTGPDGIGPLPALAVVNRQSPSAELRPASAR
ncbi:MAG TPA: nitrilase-related carbon-nitrogen hydrolase, partial [Dongiaceae bacterium]